MSIDQLLAEIESLSPDEIRERIAHVASEDKALRILLRTKLQADKERRKLAPKQGRQEAKPCK
jgi:hypothetical protein